MTYLLNCHFLCRFINNNNVLKSSFIQTSLDSMNAASHTVLSSMATTSVSDKQWLFFLKNRNQPDSNPQNFLVYQVRNYCQGDWSSYFVFKTTRNLAIIQVLIDISLQNWFTISRTALTQTAH